jgi:serine/threonine-protein kinase
MAPEQARDVKHVDSKVDIYALGVMLYVFLTGQPPFQGNTLVELISNKEKGKFDPMRKFNDEVPGKLDLIVDKMIAKDPKNRYASCQEVIGELEALGLHHEQLSFIEADVPVGTGAKKAAAPTKTPGALAAQTSIGAGKKPAAKTTAPTASGDDTAVPTEEDEEKVRDVWYWQFETETGRPITTKLSTEQVRTLIKSGHLEATARLSKTERSGFRGAGTFSEFQPTFKSLRAATRANSRVSSRGIMSDIVAEDERRRKYGWISRMFKSTGGMIFGLLWIVVILAVMGGGGYFLWTYLNK